MVILLQPFTSRIFSIRKFVTIVAVCCGGLSNINQIAFEVWIEVVGIHTPSYTNAGIADKTSIGLPPMILPTIRETQLLFFCVPYFIRRFLQVVDCCGGSSSALFRCENSYQPFDRCPCLAIIVVRTSTTPLVFHTR